MSSPLSSLKNQDQQKRTQYILDIQQKYITKLGSDNFAYLCITIAALIYPLAYVYVSMHNFSPFQYNIARGASNFMYGYLAARFFGINLDLKHTNDNKYLMIRTGIMYIQQISYIMMHYVVSISILNILSISSVIFSFVLDYFINHTKVSRTQFWGIVLGFTGIIISTNSQYFKTLIDPTYQNTSEFQHYIVHDIGLKIILSFGFLLITCFWSFSLIIQKKIKNYSSMQINHHQNILFVCISGALYPHYVHNPQTQISFLKGFFISGTISFISNTLFTTAFSISKNSGILTLLTSFTIVTSYLVSIFLYNEQVNFIAVTGLIILGYGLLKVVLN